MQLAQDTTKILSNVKTETHTFGIKQENMSFLMGILTKMYANPIQTLTQEYISNGRDANREVRATRRMEITAPGRFSPNMIIRDFGPSLSPERIKDVFLYYGSSTKRSTNTQLGGFGIGGKSAWAYTDSFTITAWHEGMKRTYIAHKSNGTGNLDMISESESNEPTGTAIEIAVNPIDVQRFKNAIIRTVFFWRDNEMPVLKGFDATEMKVFETKPDNDSFKEVKIYKDLPQVVTGDKTIAVIDGIPYPIRVDMPKLKRLIRQDFAVILNTGDVNIAPNREEFVDDKQSRDFFIALDESVNTKITNHINTELSRYGALKDGLKQYILLYRNFEFKAAFKGYTVDYHGLSVADTTKTHYEKLVLGISYDTYRNKFRRNELQSISIEAIEHVYFDDMPNEANVKKVWRVKKMLNSGKIGRIFYLLNNATVAKDLDAKPLSSIDASDYTVQRQAKAAVKKLEICCHYFDGSLNPTQVQVATVANTIVYASYNNTDGLYNKRNAREESEMIGYINNLKDHKFGFIADVYLDKIATNKHFVKYEEFIKTHKPTDNEMKYACQKAFEYDQRHLQYLKPIAKELRDPTIRYIVDLLDFKPGNNVSGRLPEKFMDKNSKIYKDFETHKAILKTFDKRYPMLYRLLDNGALEKKDSFKKDVISYLNRKYRESQKSV